MLSIMISNLKISLPNKFSQQWKFSTSFKKPNFESKYHHEIQLLSSLLYWGIVILGNKNFPGCSLENIKFPSLTLPKSFIYLIFQCVLPYLIIKAKAKTSLKSLKFLRRIETLIKIINLLILLNFIAHGSYFNLIERFLDIKYTKIQQNKRRFIDNEFLNKTILWKYYFSFLRILLPFLK